MWKGDSADLQMPSGAEPGVTGNRGNEERTWGQSAWLFRTNPRSFEYERADDVTGDGAGTSEAGSSFKWRATIRFHAAR